MIEILDISVQKGKKLIVDQVSFTIRPGNISVLMGANGAGKSTLLETLVGRNAFQGGKISWEGEDFREISPIKLAQNRSVLSQHISISFPIRVFELVEMGVYAAEQPIPNKEVKKMVAEALEEVDMLAFADRDFNHLSGGEKKRVLLAKCIVQLNCSNNDSQAKYLFLDEPTSSLDIQQQYKLLALIQKFVRQQYLGVFAILHDVNLAAQLADEILLMKDGTILAQGKPKEVLKPEILKKGLGIDCIVKPHPVYDCPHITPIQQEAAIIV